MANYKVKIIEVTPVVSKVFKIKTEKPTNYKFSPGQATDVALQYEGWENEKIPFYFTSLPQDNFLEFTIKTYPEHEGVTKRIATVAPGDEFEIDDAWGDINFKGDGVFLAGGAGVTAFLSIFKDLNQKGQLGHNQLFFSNKFEDEIIDFEHLKSLLGSRFINTITQQKGPELPTGRFDKIFLENNIKNFDQPFYICGPQSFVNDMMKFLKELGAKPDAFVTGK